WRRVSAAVSLQVRRLMPSPFNGESGNSRDASVHADGAKSRFPKRMVSALPQRNSLRVAMQIGAEGGGACPCRPFPECCPHFWQPEHNGETASSTFLWQFCQTYCSNSGQTEPNGETALLISLSQRSPNFISWRD